MTETVSEIDAEVVECSSADAAFTVLGRIDGTNDVAGTACDPVFNEKLKEGGEGYVIGSEQTDGYLLCLTPVAAK